MSSRGILPERHLATSATSSSSLSGSTRSSAKGTMASVARLVRLLPLFGSSTTLRDLLTCAQLEGGLLRT